MTGTTLSQLPVLSSVNANNSNIILFATDETGACTSYALQLSTIYTAFKTAYNSNNEIFTSNITANNLTLVAGVIATNTSAPTIAATGNIAPTRMITFISGTAAPIANITPPSPIAAGGGQITLIPTATWTTNTAGNIALASTAVVSKALIMTWNQATGKWYPSY